MPHAQTILYVEDNAVLSLAVRETLELEGWRVECCADGRAALELIEGEAHYDLLLLDDELPGVSGVELARRARSLAHRRRTPIIVISASDVERAARGAGADAFLRKPEGVRSLVGMVRRLLDASGDSGNCQK